MRMRWWRVDDEVIDIKVVVVVMGRRRWRSSW